MGDEVDGVAWLRKQIEGDGKSAAARLRRKMSADYRRVQMEKLARAKAELAILDEHYILTNENRIEAYEEFSVVPWGAKGGAGDQGSGCVTCHYYAQGGVKGYGICRTVRLLTTGYRHRPGFPASLLVVADDGSDESEARPYES